MTVLMHWVYVILQWLYMQSDISYILYMSFWYTAFHTCYTYYTCPSGILQSMIHISLYNIKYITYDGLILHANGYS